MNRDARRKKILAMAATIVPPSPDQIARERETAQRFGERLRQAMSERNWDAERTAEYLQVDANFIRVVKAGMFPVDVITSPLLIKMLALMGVTTAQLETWGQCEPSTENEDNAASEAVNLSGEPLLTPEKRSTRISIHQSSHVRQAPDDNPVYENSIELYHPRLVMRRKQIPPHHDKPLIQ